MKIFSNFIETERWEKSFKDLAHLDFSLFYDYPSVSPSTRSKINIFIACEPNEYFNNHNWVIRNAEYFDFILTWSDKILNNCENAIFCPYGESWLQDQPYEYIPTNKEFKTSFLRGDKLKLHGHTLRHELFNRQNEIKTPIQFWENLGDSNNWESWRDSKIQTFKPYKFSICIENTSHQGYFTEKITDCILNKTIPIYWGCSNISDFYNQEGMITFQNIDELIGILNVLRDEDYEFYLSAAERNYEIALGYKDYVSNVKKKIIEVFKFNKLL